MFCTGYVFLIDGSGLIFADIWYLFGWTSTCLCSQPLPVSPPLPQHNTNHQAPATPQMLPLGGGPVSSVSSCPSEENQSQLPSQVLPQPQPQGATQDPGGYMLTPNAPVLYASSYSAFEKPPPYACWDFRQIWRACCKHLHLVRLTVAQNISETEISMI